MTCVRYAITRKTHVLNCWYPVISADISTQISASNSAKLSNKIQFLILFLFKNKSNLQNDTGSFLKMLILKRDPKTTDNFVLNISK